MASAAAASQSFQREYHERYNFGNTLLRYVAGEWPKLRSKILRELPPVVVQLAAAVAAAAAAAVAAAVDARAAEAAAGARVLLLLVGNAPPVHRAPNCLC